MYRHCSLCKGKYAVGVKRGYIEAYYRAHGSPLVPFPEAAANFLGSKPVMEGRGAMVKELSESAILHDAHELPIGGRDGFCVL